MRHTGYKSTAVIFLASFFLLLLSQAMVYAKTQFIWDADSKTTPSSRIEDPEKNLKEIEEYFLKTGNGKWEVGGGKNRLLDLRLLLEISKRRNDTKGLDTALRGIRNLSKEKRDIEELTTLALLYLDAYKEEQESTFKDLARETLKTIDGLYYKNGLDGDSIETPLASNIAIAFLYGGDLIAGEYRERGIEILDFISKNLIGKEGAFHIYNNKTREARMDGQIEDNLWAGMAFAEGYKVTSQSKYIPTTEYLKTAAALADFSIERLFDKKFGGFFKRNSNSLNFYPPEKLFLDEKPLEANGFMALFLLKLYSATGDSIYLERAEDTLLYLKRHLKTLASQDGYPLVLAYKTLLDANKGLKTADKKGIAPDLTKGFAPEVPKVGLFAMLLLAFAAGILSFVSPCTLPILPAYFACTFQSDRKRIIIMTFAFFLGLALVFSFMGATATLIGSFIRKQYSLLLTVGGAVIVFMGIMSLLGKGFTGFHFKGRPATSFSGSFIFGCTIAVGWTACVGPILAGILVLASTQEGTLSGPILLFVYALGLSLPMMLLSAFFHRLNRDGLFWRIIRGKGWAINLFGREFCLHTNNMIAGGLFILLGILMMTGYLTYINRALPIELQVWFAGVEERLLEIVR